MSDLPSRTLADFIAALGADRPTPGCGSAGALALALAASCARKAIVISARHRNGDPALVEAAAQCARISSVALHGVAADAEHFAAFIHSHGAASREIGDLRADSDALLQDGAALRALLAVHADAIDPVLGADAAAAHALLAAAEAIIRRNLAELPA